MAAKSRFVDQNGQWKSTTPASVKKRQAKALAALEKKKSGGKSNGKRK